ncbi:DNA double-strand break repair nuclease NurA [Gemmata sp. JC673]|uniref:DNA double-strand break repair nuclease NurA n=1 Tax=Gemmata algarum TaxID=2975278 RepID=A0ABU5FA16_9BACT|nr:DNA double-strand break repair nuclease NurA [Gemmata algarum]MDY3562679.1 DNA double-strand break repair nuclease NurA [Gemmata algarum]
MPPRDAGRICQVEINHGEFWPTLRGKRVGFIDGGVANLEAVGAAPVAIRVGSYTVIPGDTGDQREQFRFERQLIGELFSTSATQQGFFDDLSEDPAPLRDVARFCLEVAGAQAAATTNPPPDWLLLHGPLVNPVAMYDRVPNFSTDGLNSLLPAAEVTGRTGKHTHFISVYRRQLELLRDSAARVCGVVERASGSRLVASTLLNELAEAGHIDASFRDYAGARLNEYRIADALLFQVVLEPGEYLQPVTIDRNDVRRAPTEWQEFIGAYPKPRVSFVNVSDVAQPLRVECFDKLPADEYPALFGLVVHSARLLPRYAFPAGLDIVDKHAKLPDWLAKPINSRLATQMLRKAIEVANKEGEPRLLTAMWQLLAGTTRDFFFRPKA